MISCDRVLGVESVSTAAMSMRGVMISRTVVSSRPKTPRIILRSSSSMVALVFLELHEAQHLFLFLARRRRDDGADGQVEDAGGAAEEELEGAHERREAQAPALRVARDDGPRHRFEQRQPARARR